MTDWTGSQQAIEIVPLIIFIGPVYDAALEAANAVWLTGVPVGVRERNARVRIRLPHKRRVAVVVDDALSAREEYRVAAGYVVARRRG